MKTLWVVSGLLLLASSQIHAMPSTTNPWQLRFQTTNTFSPSINLTDLDPNDGTIPWAQISKVQIRATLFDNGTVFSANLSNPATQHFDFNKSIDNVDFTAKWNGTALDLGIISKSGSMYTTPRQLSLSVEVYVDLDFSARTMITASNAFYLEASGDPDCDQGGNMWGLYGIGDSASDFYCWEGPQQRYVQGGSYSWSEDQNSGMRLGYAAQVHMTLPQRPVNVPVPATDILTLLGLGLLQTSRIRR
ncbi:hypothetical protein [Chitinivorax sp. B]|uniref:hypothetical protein n=1 Tax=Chitinivorax sp. B TaxID=2502235 RepID=UPI0010F467E0|nr:hypothetical protein [Chitinivorax sp. B]